MNTQEPGITITLREIYDSVQTVSDALERMEGKFASLEEKSLSAIKAERQSQEALQVAQEAYKLAEDAHTQLLKERSDKEEQRSWFKRTIIAAMIPYLVSAGLLAISYLSNQ
ncbi:hypothetical protein CHI12_11025 [Terribacillus saccharophilus]|uniref:Uncharacterized protein n=1 Tax=Terribacillus saccharophilus TaxID=361277 RepID=A0A268HCC2_9BACI|nr:hypothetical protein [Terribacillus saccharophilus]PAE07494.1 hypothetical protein CHI12_11025 [Terribacillus saccharophilus]